MKVTPPWWTNMWGCMEKAKELGISYEELISKYVGEDFENLFNPTISKWVTPSILSDVMSREIVDIFRVDNGFLLKFSKQQGEHKLVCNKVFSTEGEVQVGIQELRVQFDNLIREKAEKVKD